ELHLGDPVVIRGRWVYDAGHSGYNEFHAVHTIQKIENERDCTFDGYAGEKWCQHTMEIPPQPPLHVKTMTPEQQTVFDNQRRPENRWCFHPDLDGCQPPAPSIR